jgi:uncharacterized protein DUF6058
VMIANETARACVQPCANDSMTTESFRIVARYVTPMHALNVYLAQYFFDRTQLAEACGISASVLHELIDLRLVPAPSYVVRDSVVRSTVFGELSAPGAKSGEYFHRATTIWVARALDTLTHGSRRDAPERVATLFRSNLETALANLNCSLWRIADCFDDQCTPIAAGLRARCDSMWSHFIDGTYGVCVAHPISEYTIARKELLQEKLVALTANGARRDFPPDEAREVAYTIESYAAACMPFSPVDYPLSSRKRLVDSFVVPRLRA